MRLVRSLSIVSDPLTARSVFEQIYTAQGRRVMRADNLSRFAASLSGHPRFHLSLEPVSSYLDNFADIRKIGVLVDEFGRFECLIQHDEGLKDPDMHQLIGDFVQFISPGAPGEIVFDMAIHRSPTRVTHYRMVQDQGDQPLADDIDDRDRAKTRWAVTDVTELVEDFRVTKHGAVYAAVGREVGQITPRKLPELLRRRQPVIQECDFRVVLEDGERLAHYTPPGVDRRCIATWLAPEVMRGVTRCRFTNGEVSHVSDDGMTSFLMDKRTLEDDGRPQVLGVVESCGDIVAHRVDKVVDVGRYAPDACVGWHEPPIQLGVGLSLTEAVLDDEASDDPTEEIVFERGVTPLGPDNRPTI